MALTTITHDNGYSKDSATKSENLQMAHHLVKKMTMMVCKVSGDPLKHREFQNEVQTSSYNHGGREHLNSMFHTSSAGPSIVIAKMSVGLIPLFPKL